METITSDRPLAVVVKILELLPIPNADAIEVAKVLGWQVIVKKGEFVVGDLGIYFCIDSVLPKDNLHFAFLEGKPLKTRKMRNTLSQGLLAPLSWASETLENIANLKEGDDLTKSLGITKYISPEESSLYKNDGTRGPFPSIVSKTDEERVQNAKKKLFDFANKPVIITQKYDGTSTTFIMQNEKFTICGRNHALLVENGESFPYFEIAKRYNLENSMKQLSSDETFVSSYLSRLTSIDESENIQKQPQALKLNIAIQGEIIGQRKDGRYKINSNRHKLSDMDFYVFNIFDIDKQYYMKWEEVCEITTILGLKTVPVIYSGIMKEELLNSDALITMATEQKYEGGHICEGIVIKTNEGFGFPRLSFKAISNEYLLKYKL
jgi:RNA ligase (TIGR02306 family)